MGRCGYRCQSRGPALSATVDFIGLEGLLPEEEPENGNGENGENGNGEKPKPGWRGRAWVWSMEHKTWTARPPAPLGDDLVRYIAALEKRVAELEADSSPVAR